MRSWVLACSGAFEGVSQPEMAMIMTDYLIRLLPATTNILPRPRERETKLSRPAQIEGMMSIEKYLGSWKRR